MAGLLDFLDSGDAQLGLGLLAAASARSDGAGFGQRLLEGVGHAQNWKQQKKKDEYAQTLLDAQKFEMEQKRLEAQQKQAAFERDAKIQAGMGQFFKPGQQALSPLVGDPSIGIMPSAGRAAVAPSFDANGASAFLAQNGDYKGAFEMMDKFKPVQVKLKNVEQMKDPQTGKMVNVALYENGETKVLPFGVKPDMQILSLGDRQVAVDKNSVAPGQSFAFGQSPDSKASNAVAWANNALSRQRLNLEREKFADEKGQSTLKSTDGERTAGALLQRMRSSQLQMETALKGGKTGAEKPSLIAQGLRGVGAEALANTWNSEARQQVEAAQLDILDAALTLGTGAAYTREQLEGYRKSYFPQIGDDPKTVQDKKARLENILSAAEVKAGRSASSVPTVEQMRVKQSAPLLNVPAGQLGSGTFKIISVE